MGNWLMILMGVTLSVSGIRLAFRGLGDGPGSTKITERFDVDGPAWLVLAGIGAAMFAFGALRLDTGGSAEVRAQLPPIFGGSDDPPSATTSAVSPTPAPAALTPTASANLPSNNAAPAKPKPGNVLLRSSGAVGDIAPGTSRASTTQSLAALWGPPSEERLLDSGGWKVRWGELNIVFDQAEQLSGWQFVSHLSPHSRSNGIQDTPSVAVEGDELRIEMTARDFGQFDPKSYYPVGDEFALCEQPNDPARPADVVCAHFLPPLVAGGTLADDAQIIVLEAYG